MLTLRSKHLPTHASAAVYRNQSFIQGVILNFTGTLRLGASWRVTTVIFTDPGLADLPGHQPERPVVVRPEPHHDPDQIAYRPDHCRLRHRDRRHLVRDAMGRGDAGLPAGTGAGMVHLLRHADLSPVADFPVVVSLRRLCAGDLRPRRDDRRYQRLHWLRGGDMRITVASPATASCHDLWLGAMGHASGHRARRPVP